MTPFQNSAPKQNKKLLLTEEEFLDHYAVLGHPIKHSLSPLIHRLFSEQTHQPLIYSAILVPLNGLSEALDHFQAKQGKGVNITLPFKQSAYRLVNTHTERATLAQAINTIRFHADGSRIGDNTDGIGLLRDLTQNQQISLVNKQILILGAGGAVRGILGPLLNEKPAAIVIANRTESKADELVSQFKSLGNISACSLTLIRNHSFDIIINAISGALPNLPSDFDKKTFCYDLCYGNNDTVFLRWAKKLGIHSYCDGLGMLVEQAAEAFYFWRGVKPETKPVIERLRKISEDHQG